ncbi:MAG: hypothetical protein A2X49_16025 [Lentisphaerae bacterium GWF2_52_8]|nr:MAG: hypothetical protein A2X49_16025 [Lentisphaerae bacterium GWF2_52_8]
MDVSIIIVNWNSAAFVRKCVSSVGEHTRGLSVEIVVLDSGSFDGCGEMLAREFPHVRFIQSDKNLGFARGNNVAARQATGRFLIFLNPDTELRGPAVSKLFEAAASLPKAGVLGARLLNSDGTLQTSCLQNFPTIANQILDADLLRKWFPRSRLWGTAPLYAEVSAPVEVEGISGACLMTPRTLFEQVGGFNEEYFMYYEDMDYCLKVHKAGWKSYYAPAAVVVHHGGQSSGGEHSKFSSVMMAESGWRFFRTQRSPVQAAMFRACLAAKAASRTCALALFCLFAPSESRRKRARSALGKWTSVLRWAFGGEKETADLR